MLAHSPSLSLVIDHYDEHHFVTTKEQERIILALRQRDRVHRVYLRMRTSIMQKLVMGIDAEYSMLEYLILETSAEHGSLASVLPKSLEAPRLRYLLLMGIVPPIGTRLLTTAVVMVTLCLYMPKPTAYFQPNILLQCLSSMPLLETQNHHRSTSYSRPCGRATFGYANHDTRLTS